MGRSKGPANKKHKVTATKSKPAQDFFEDDMSSSSDNEEESNENIDVQVDDDDDDFGENDEYELDHDENDNVQGNDRQKIENVQESDNDENDAEAIVSLKNKAAKEKKKKKKKKVSREPGLDVEETRSEMESQIRLILDTKVDASQHLKSKYPILAKAKGKSRALLTQLEKWEQEEQESIKKQKETDLILNQSHTKPTIAQYMHERELNVIATQGVIKLLNQVVEAKRKAKEKNKEKKYDAYEILKKFEGNKYLQV